MKILTDWNPLGNKASKISDLDNYSTEADDIIFNIDFQDANTESKVITLVKNIWFLK